MGGLAPRRSGDGDGRRYRGGSGHAGDQTDLPSPAAAMMLMLAHNRRECLRALERHRPCLILLDLMMPVMDGLTFLVERKRRDIAADVPVVCVSAGGQEMVAHALRLGAKECIPKPADLEQLCERVGHYCS